MQQSRIFTQYEVDSQMRADTLGEGLAEPSENLMPAGTQFSLFELFFATTLSAVAVALYAYVSPLFALLAGGSLIVFAIIRWFQASNMVFGGLVGFGSSMIISWAIVAALQAPIMTSIFVVLFFPAMGYLMGVAFYTMGDQESF